MRLATHEKEDAKDGGGPYWLYVAIEEFASLEKLDRLLREVWLECCGHLSHFECPSGTYEVCPEPGERRMKGMSVLVALPEGVAVRYEYDYGSTTELAITRIGELRAKAAKPALVMARNSMPGGMCGLCNKAKATQISGIDGKLVCDACAGKLGEDSEYLLPYVNSPRTGVCGYSGED